MDRGEEKGALSWGISLSMAPLRRADFTRSVLFFLNSQLQILITFFSIIANEHNDLVDEAFSYFVKKMFLPKVERAAKYVILSRIFFEPSLSLSAAKFSWS